MTEFFIKNRHSVICIGILFFISLVGCIMVEIRKFFIVRPGFSFLIWNLFLAWIPLGLSAVISFVYTSKTIKRKLLITLPAGVFWLLFYPNAPYMITDFIHFKAYGSFLVWFDLVIYSIFIWTSFLLGFFSIYQIERIVAKITNKYLGWLFVLVVLFLSSYAIYLGRFIRWNSWDMVFNPLDLFQSIVDNINYQSLGFSMVYALLLTMMYAFLYGLTYLKTEEAE